MKWVIDSDTLTDIADAIREQLGESDDIAVTDLADKILEIEGGTTPSEMVFDYVEVVAKFNDDSGLLTYDATTNERSIDLSIIDGYELVGVALNYVSQINISSGTSNLCVMLHIDLDYDYEDYGFDDISIYPNSSTRYGLTYAPYTWSNPTSYSTRTGVDFKSCVSNGKYNIPATAGVPDERPTYRVRLYFKEA